MGFLRSIPGKFAIGLAAMLLVAVLWTALQVHRAITPSRTQHAPASVRSVMGEFERVEFPAADGIALRGWMLRGRRAQSPVILCHDYAAGKASLVHLALMLRDRGRSVLLFDFRGHGESGGRRSTLGMAEKRDVLGAVEFLNGVRDIDARSIGVYGVGMGAHAAVLAASDTPRLRVLVLDALYPDAAFSLRRRVFPGRELRPLAPLVDGTFGILAGTSARGQRAADVIGSLLDRDVLLLAPADDPRLVDAMRMMYETIPEQADTDPNLVVLPATHGVGLHGDMYARYNERVAGFFDRRLGARLRG